PEVIEVLYNATEGRVRHIFRLATQLIYATADNELIDEINLEIAEPLLKMFVKERIALYNISPATHDILKKLVATQPITTGELAKKLKVAQPGVSRALTALQKAKLAYCKIEGKKHVWMAEPDVTITYSER
ncbi:MAG: helix-turn-helix domain-containing protein, partial [Candidatus Thermoplasmatota archaeon]|nr:helix-turn-helix domain-containing protein [Candidatus Thermoplasmatota archaeon]